MMSSNNPCCSSRDGVSIPETQLKDSSDSGSESDASFSSTFQDEASVGESLNTHFRERQRLLQQVVAKNPNLRRQIELRERLVRYGTLQKASTLDERIRSQRDAAYEELVLAQQSSKWYDALVFEWHSGVMSSLSLFLHCWAYVGIEHVLFAFAPEQPGLRVATLVLSLLALRLTGDIYYWLAEDVSVCAEHDWGNRLVLADPMAKWIAKLRKNKILRTALFIAGYSFCFESFMEAVDVFERVLFDDWQMITDTLPSTIHKGLVSICPAKNMESFCGASCQASLIEECM